MAALKGNDADGLLQGPATDPLALFGTPIEAPQAVPVVEAAEPAPEKPVVEPEPPPVKAVEPAEAPDQADEEAVEAPPVKGVEGLLAAAMADGEKKKAERETPTDPGDRPVPPVRPVDADKATADLLAAFDAKEKAEAVAKRLAWWHAHRPGWFGEKPPKSFTHRYQALFGLSPNIATGKWNGVVSGAEIDPTPPDAATLKALKRYDVARKSYGKRLKRWREKRAAYEAHLRGDLPGPESELYADGIVPIPWLVNANSLGRAFLREARDELAIIEPSDGAGRDATYDTWHCGADGIWTRTAKPFHDMAIKIIDDMYREAKACTARLADPDAEKWATPWERAAEAAKPRLRAATEQATSSNGNTSLVDRARKQMATTADHVGTSVARHTADEFDADVKVMPVADGLVDLATGKLLEAGPAAQRLYTLRGPTEYKPDAEEDAAMELFAHMDGEIAEYFLNVLAFALHGDNQRSLVSVVGPPASGKSSIIAAVRAAEGPKLAQQANKTVLALPRFAEPNAPEPSLEAFAAPAKHTFIDEVKSGFLATELCKQISAGGSKSVVTYRKLHQNEESRKITSTTFVFANAIPRFETTDAALASRLIILPWSAVPRDKLDPDFMERRIHEPEFRESLLAALIRRAVAMHGQPKPTPPAVVASNTNAMIKQLAGPLAVAADRLEPGTNADFLSAADAWEAVLDAHEADGGEREKDGKPLTRIRGATRQTALRKMLEMRAEAIGKPWDGKTERASGGTKPMGVYGYRLGHEASECPL